jgi:hypothetical protein
MLSFFDAKKKGADPTAARRWEKERIEGSGKEWLPEAGSRALPVHG